MYRPEGWENPYQYEASGVSGRVKGVLNLQHLAVEAGADAMLVALREEMKDFGTHHTIGIFIEEVMGEELAWR